MAKMNRWGEEKTLRFVELYKRHECLWNVKSPQYKDKSARQKAYESFLHGMKDENMTVDNIKTKIKNLRTTYHQELKKINESAKADTGDDTVYVCSLIWFYEMHSFIGEPAIKKEKSVDLSWGTDQMSEVEPASPQTSVNPLQEFSDSDEMTLAQPSSSRAPNQRKKRKVNERSDRSLSASTGTDDEFYYFGLNVASQLRQMSLEKALNAQMDIQNVLTQARLGKKSSNKK